MTARPIPNPWRLSITKEQTLPHSEEFLCIWDSMNLLVCFNRIKCGMPKDQHTKSVLPEYHCPLAKTSIYGVNVSSRVRASITTVSFSFWTTQCPAFSLCPHARYPHCILAIQ